MKDNIYGPKDKSPEALANFLGKEYYPIDLADATNEKGGEQAESSHLVLRSSKPNSSPGDGYYIKTSITASEKDRAEWVVDTIGQSFVFIEGDSETMLVSFDESLVDPDFSDILEVNFSALSKLDPKVLERGDFDGYKAMQEIIKFTTVGSGLSENYRQFMASHVLPLAMEHEIKSMIQSS